MTDAPRDMPLNSDSLPALLGATPCDAAGAAGAGGRAAVPLAACGKGFPFGAVGGPGHSGATAEMRAEALMLATHLLPPCGHAAHLEALGGL
jgi:hypothetical protein